jgi:hypothetical protein
MRATTRGCAVCACGGAARALYHGFVAHGQLRGGFRGAERRVAIDDEDVVEQARSVLEDVTVSAWKAGFLGSAETVAAVAEATVMVAAVVPLVATRATTVATARAAGLIAQATPNVHVLLVATSSPHTAMHG